MDVQACAHIAAIGTIKHPRKLVCDECVKTGDDWVHLRTCQQCGATHCCDSSPNRHATKHYRLTAHPIITSVEPGETWVWCYADELALAG